MTKRSEPARAIRASIRKGRIVPPVAAREFEGEQVLIVRLPQKQDPVRTLQPSDPEWAELAALCGWTSEEMEREFSRPWDEEEALREFEEVSAYFQKRARALGIRTQADLNRFLAKLEKKQAS